MTALIACYGKNVLDYDIEYITKTINLLETLNSTILKVNNGFFAVSYHKKAPLKGDRLFNNEEWTAVFAGDLIQEIVPWELILNTLNDGEYKRFENLKGFFSIVAFNKIKNKIFLISDRTSYQPIFYLLDNTNIFISTELSTFCRLPIDIEFNEEWMWEYLFFHFPIGDITFLKNVKRLSPASILEINVKTGEHVVNEYTPKFQKKKDLLKSEKAFERAYMICHITVPQYIKGDDEIGMALTSGWDTRTNLSFCLKKGALTSYTYGQAGCEDLVEASKIAEAIGIKHKQIIFDRNFHEQFKSLIFETVFCSSGLERIARSTVFYAYKNFTDTGNKFPLIISGIDWDGLFRGHWGQAVVSNDMSRIFSSGEKSIDEKFWKQYFKKNYSNFEKYILHRIDYLEKQYGKLSTPEAQISYSIYEIDPKYFGGESAVARHFTTVRIPSLDRDIIDLSYSIENSALSFSQFLSHHKRGSKNEMVLQAYMISRNGGKLSEYPIGGASPKDTLKNEYIYRFILMKNLLVPWIKKKLFKKEFTSCEAWPYWLNNIYRDFIDDLIFSKDAEIYKYVNYEDILQLKEKRNIQLISKFVTIEIILRLINNEWNRFW